MSKPLLTVAVTSYNYAHYLPVCLDSILGQDFTDFELYILDNCSTDNTQEVVKQYLSDARVHYVRHVQNIGSPSNFNYGCKVGTGRYFAMISADDFILPGHFSNLIQKLIANPHCALAYSKMCQVDSHGTMIGQAGHGGNTTDSYIGGRDEETDLLLHGVYQCLPAIIFNRAMIGDYLSFDFDTWGASDWDLMVRIARRHPDFIYDNRVTTCYRRHAGQYTSTNFYLSPEPLYGHMFMLEQALVQMPPHKIAQYGPRFAALLRNWSMQFGLSQLEAAQRKRLSDLLEQLDHGVAKLAPGKTLKAGLVSVILPLSHSSTHIDEVLNGLRGQVEQDWEAVIVHPKSLDSAVLAKYLQSGDRQRRMWLLPHDGDNMAEQLNAGMQHCSGDVILVLDQRVELAPHALQAFTRELGKHSKADIVSIDESLRYSHATELPPQTLSKCNPVPLLAAFRRRVFNVAGGFNAGVGNTLVMHDFWIRALKRGVHLISLAGVASSITKDCIEAHSAIDRARMLFANPEIGTAEEVRDAALLLLRERHTWLKENANVLNRNPANSTAYWLRNLARTDEPKSNDVASAPSPLGVQEYTRWVLENRPSEPRTAALLRAMDSRAPLTISAIVLASDVPAEQLQRTLQSLATQVRPPQRIVVIGAASQPGLAATNISWLPNSGPWQTVANAVMQQLTEDWLYLISAGDSLEPIACALLAETAAFHPELALVYADEDALHQNGNVHDYVFKPALNLDLARSSPYIGRNIALRRTAALEVGGFASNVGEAARNDLLLRMVEAFNFASIAHIDRVLFHTIEPLAQWRKRPEVCDGMHIAVREHLLRLGLRAQILATGNGLQRVVYQHAENAAISIIVRSSGTLESLKNCLTGVLEKTFHTRFEILVINPDDRYIHAEEARAWLAQLAQSRPRVRIIDSGGISDASATLNLAVTAAAGDYLLFLEDSVRLTQTDWLDVLQAYAQRPEVGVVAPKLIDQDGRIVSGGVVMGLNGVVGDVFAGAAADAPGYQDRLLVDQNYTAVRGACMLVNKSVFQALGGFDVTFSSAARDIDLCLRIRAAGYLCVWTPHVVAEIQRSELQNAGQWRQELDDNALLARTWWKWIGQDVAFNRNLSLSEPCIAIETRPELNSGLTLDPESKRLVVIHLDGGSRSLKDVLESFAQETNLEITRFQTLPSPWDLAKLGPQTILIDGLPDGRFLPALRELRRLSPLKLACYQAHATSAISASDFRETCKLVDRLIFSDQAIRNVPMDSAIDTCVINEALPEMPVTRYQRAAKSRDRLRVGLPADLLPESWSILLPVLEAIHHEIDLIVYATRYPLALRGLSYSYRQLSPFQANHAAFLAELDLDLALVLPMTFNREHGELLHLGACATAVLAAAGSASAADLPCHVAEPTTAEWLAQLRHCLGQPQQLLKDGVLLRQAVLTRRVIDSGLRGRWAKALWLDSPVP
ncbi:hypothetical protein RB25_09740 [Herbaspirillum rubrisubalbicans]|uniref:Glycosyltransferase 2-like domain-containing protein n=1 Tax=Herbaspirillum rubrisubalbicans TaxID=80842 RepID=A0ABX9BZZ1_9BURK|nr:glycosyltransferase [Herbaspirillum rubrisubalbicans]RAM63596.1 hypothetical protein RB24_16095 [Herbaspirillum rubrisubalbicans]RAN48614.1 hypothetical protein RB25_09740 [Herbaspirillum rubrisubalbicans]